MDFRRRAKAHYRSMALIDSASLRRVYSIRPSTIHGRFSQAREVSHDAKESFLPLSKTISASGAKLMEEVSRIDPWAATQLGLKSLAVQNFVMRLWYESCEQGAPPHGEVSSFIILSYTWHDPAVWTRHRSLGCPSSKEPDDALPLTPAMWSAFLSQRLSPSEGLWCDQLCIVQDDSSPEKKLAIGAMDLLYKNARKVVVALEDVAITKDEMDALFQISMSFSPSQQQGGRIARAFERIVFARWFRRAWCMHEFLVSRNHTFLVPVFSEEGGDGVVTIVGLDALFLAIMADYFGKTEYLGFLSKKYTLLATPDQDLSLIHSFGTRLKLLSTIEGDEPELFYFHGTYTGMQTFSEIFSLGAKVMSDKISILLNVMNSGLYYLGPVSITEEDCLRLATVVALATGDPEALTTNGGRVHDLPSRKSEAQWLRWPILQSTTPQLMSDPHLPRVSTDLALTEQGLQLDMQLICTSADLISPEPRYISISRLLIEHREECSISSSDRESALWQEHQDEHKSRRLRTIQALACALQLGQDWIHEVHDKLHLSADVQGRRRNHRLNVLKRAAEWALSLDLEKGLGSDRGETWIENGRINVTSSILSPEAENLYYNLLQFADRLSFTDSVVTNDGGHRDVSNCADNDSAVQMLRLSNANAAPFLVFAPNFDQSGLESSLALCIPEVLAKEAYRDLLRLWILKECREDGKERTFELVSKTRLIGPAGVPKGERMRKVVIAG